MTSPRHVIAELPVTLLFSPRARRLRLRLDPRTRGLCLTVPPRISERRALAWAAEQGDWARQALARLPEPLAIAPGAALPFRGTEHVVDWDPGRPRTVRVEAGRLVVGGPADGLEGRIVRWLRKEALRLLSDESREIGAQGGLEPVRVGVGDPVSRWGSCSSRGAIRYSWRLILAPDFVRRATVAHELAHLVHLNHGPDFHRLAAELLGEDPNPARLWLRRHGAALHRIAPRR
jgi:predicted metal-dependent hydrolase